MVPWKESWPRNVWLGTTAENQLWLIRRAHELARYPATVRFLSCEPLLGSLDLAPIVTALDWVIAGGESGAKARPTHPAWFRSLRDQCTAFGISFHFKQWGEWAPAEDAEDACHRRMRIVWKGEPASLERRGKRLTGRLLDGRTWDEVPLARRVACAGNRT
jgi:protein gp37